MSRRGNGGERSQDVNDAPKGNHRMRVNHLSIHIEHRSRFSSMSFTMSHTMHMFDGGEVGNGGRERQGTEMRGRESTDSGIHSRVREGPKALGSHDKMRNAAHMQGMMMRMMTAHVLGGMMAAHVLSNLLAQRAQRQAPSRTSLDHATNSDSGVEEDKRTEHVEAHQSADNNVSEKPSPVTDNVLPESSEKRNSHVAKGTTSVSSPKEPVHTAFEKGVTSVSSHNKHTPSAFEKNDIHQKRQGVIERTSSVSGHKASISHLHNHEHPSAVSEHHSPKSHLEPHGHPSSVSRSE